MSGGKSRIIKSQDTKEQRPLLEGDSDEDFFLKGPQATRVRDKSDHAKIQITRVENEVDEVKGIMQSNLTKVLERGEQLENLKDRSERVSANSEAFHTRARSLHRNFWFNDWKMKILLFVILVVIILIIIVAVIMRHSKDS